MPPVVQVAIAYGSGLWVGLALLGPLEVRWFLTLVAVLLATRGWRGLLALVFALGWWTGVATGAREAASCQAAWPRGEYAALVRIHDAPDRRGLTSATVLHAIEGCDGRLILRARSHTLPAGSRVVVVGEYRGRRVLAVRHARVFPGTRAFRYRVRAAVARKIGSLYGPRAGVVEALVLGRKSGIDPRMRDDFVAAGLAHLLAISGLHVGVLAGWVLLLFSRLGARRSAWVWGAVVIWAYVALLGFPTPATRAAGFLSVIGVARARQRHPPASAVLAVAVLLIVATDPAAVTSVGAWLSVAAVWGTRFGMQVIPGPRLLGASVGATVATSPITAFAFGSVAPIGILTNLAAVPLAGVAVPGVFLSLAFGGVMAAVAGAVLAAIEFAAQAGARVPGGHLSTEPGAAAALPWLGAFLAAIWMRRVHGSWRRLRRWAAALAVVAWLCVAVDALVGRDRSAGLSLHVLDVGQGDAIAVRTRRGSWVLVDGGPRGAAYDAGRRVVVPFLERRGARRLAAVIATHGDADHLGGIPAVLDAIPTSMVLDPGQALGTPLYLEFHAALDALGIDWRPARAGDVFSIDSVQFEVLHPGAEWLRDHLEPNENSVVLRITYGCFVALLTGDIGWPAESVLVDGVGRAHLLKVAHHGSAGGTTDAWLEAVSPDVAIVSVGRNRYGHPARPVLERLQARRAAVFRTDRGGTVTIRTDGRYFEMTQGQPTSLPEYLTCLIRPLLRSSGSSWSRSACIRRPRVSLPTCSTTSRSPPRSFPAMSGVRVSWTSSAQPDPRTSRANSSKSSTSWRTRSSSRQ